MRLKGRSAMSFHFSTDLEEPFNALLKQGEWDEYVSLLSQKGLIWFLEMDFPRLVAPLMPVNSIPQEVHRPPRLAFFSEAIEPFVNASVLERHYESFMEAGDPDAAAAAAAFGLNLALEKGDRFSRFKPWHQKCEQLLEQRQDISTLAQAALLIQLGMKKYVLMGDMNVG
jgi:hypothetical protein